LKHLFLIVNNINKSICEEVVRNLKIPSEDVIFLYRRAGVEPTKYCRIDFYQTGMMFGLNDSGYLRFLVSVLKLWVFRIKRFDSFIESLSQGEVFEVYVPHIYQDDLSLVSSHKLCSKISLVEEGDASYAKERFLDPLGKGVKRRKPWRYYLLNILGLKKRVGGFCFFPDTSLLGQAFCMSEDAFPFYGNAKTVLSAKLCLGQSIRREGEGSMILIDPLVSLKRVKQSVYLDKFNEFIREEYSRLKLKRIFISFHPTIRLDEEFIESVVEVLDSHGVEFEIFEGNAERLIGEYEKFLLYGLVSSTMRYGCTLGAEVYSWLSKFKDQDFSGKSRLLEYYEEVGVELI